MSGDQAAGAAAPSGSLPRLTGLAEILDAVSREVTSAARTTCKLQEALSPLLCTLGQDEGMIKDIQALDLIAQHLHGLAGFLDALAPTLPVEWAGDAAAAARTVSLSNLARRLGGLEDCRIVRDGHEDKSPEHDMIELFD